MHADGSISAGDGNCTAREPSPLVFILGMDVQFLAANEERTGDLYIAKQCEVYSCDANY